MTEEKQIKPVQPKYGFTERPEAGYTIYIVTLICFFISTIAPWLIRLFAGAEKSAEWFAQGTYLTNPIMMVFEFQVVSGMVLVMWHSITTKGIKRALLAFGCVFFIAWFNEFLGTHFGLVFGPYHYSDALPWHIFGVPLIVAPAWEITTYPAFYLTLYLMPSELMGKTNSWLQKVLTMVLFSAVGSFIITANDMLTDPFWVKFQTWEWHTNGSYAGYLDGGEPLSNFFGWMLTGFMIQLVYHLIIDSTPKERHIHSKYLDIYIPLMIYITGFTFGVSGQLLFAKQYDVLLIGIMTIGAVILMTCTKLFLEKQGARSNPIGTRLVEDALLAKPIIRE